MHQRPRARQVLAGRRQIGVEQILERAVRNRPRLELGQIDVTEREDAERLEQCAGVVGDGWLTYYYTVEGFAKSWDKVRQFAEEAGKDPDTLRSINQLPIYIGKSRDDVKDLMQEWLTTEWDFAGWSDSTAASAVIGTVDDCIEQLQAHLDVGVQQITLVPYRFDREQIEQIAEEIIPRIG